MKSLTETIHDLKEENQELKSQNARIIVAERTATIEPLSISPHWDAYSKIDQPSLKSAYWKAHETDLRWEQVEHAARARAMETSSLNKK